MRYPLRHRAGCSPSPAPAYLCLKTRPFSALRGVAPGLCRTLCQCLGADSRNPRQWCVAGVGGGVFPPARPGAHELGGVGVQKSPSVSSRPGGGARRANYNPQRAARHPARGRRARRGRAESGGAGLSEAARHRPVLQLARSWARRRRRCCRPAQPVWMAGGGRGRSAAGGRGRAAGGAGRMARASRGAKPAKRC